MILYIPIQKPNMILYKSALLTITFSSHQWHSDYVAFSQHSRKYIIMTYRSEFFLSCLSYYDLSPPIALSDRNWGSTLYKL